MSERAKDCIARGLAPVKLQYLKPPRTAADAPAVPQPVAAPVSKRQQKKEYGRAKTAAVCHSFLQGRCTYSTGCKFSHDLAAYLASKPDDLPGTCPFVDAATCPYGITCRYARSHRYQDAQHDLVTAHYAATAAAATAAADAAAAATAAAASAAPPSGADAEQPTDAAPLAAAEGASLAAPEGSLLPAAVPPVPAAEVQVEVLPSLGPVLGLMNLLEKDTTVQLWKDRYDFGRADAVLRARGYKVSFKTRPAPKAPAAAAAAAAPVSAAAPATTEAAPPPASTEGEAAPDTDGFVGGPALKKARTDAEPGSSGDAPVASSPAAAAPHPAAAAALSVAERAAATAAWRAQHVEVRLRGCEKVQLDFRGKTYLAPLTTVGNLPFRRVCKGLGVDITCGEMALATNLIQGQQQEWALLKRHPCEDLFGVQVCGGYADALGRCAQLLDEFATVDFVDVNMGCPIDLICEKGAGSSLLCKPKRIEEISRAMSSVLSCPLTLKMRKGYMDDHDVTHTFVSQLRSWGACALTLHGRTRQQRYSRAADWEYIERCAVLDPELQLVGNGDVFSYEDWNRHMATGSGLASCMVARGALIKPWVFTEIKEQRHWDISAGERLDLMKQFCSAGLEHWGSDGRGVENTRRFLLEWLSFTHRYVPIGLLEVVPQEMQWRPPAFVGRSDLETLLGSADPEDWVRITRMLLGPTPPGYTFAPKHKSNAYAAPSAGGKPRTGKGGGWGDGPGAAGGEGDMALDAMDDEANG